MAMAWYGHNLSVGGSHPQSSWKIGLHLASSQILGDVHTTSQKNGGCKLQKPPGKNTRICGWMSNPRLFCISLSLSLCICVYINIHIDIHPQMHEQGLKRNLKYTFDCFI